MKKIIYLSFIFVFLLSNASTCDKEKCHKKIAFVNNSSKELYISFTIRTLDTLRFYKNFSNPYENPEAYRVKQGKTNIIKSDYRDCFEYFISNSREDGLIVYVFDSEVLATVPWDTIGKYYMVLKTLRPTLAEMERDNWTIYFTGE